MDGGVHGEPWAQGGVGRTGPDKGQSDEKAEIYRLPVWETGVKIGSEQVHLDLLVKRME